LRVKCLGCGAEFEIDDEQAAYVQSFGDLEVLDWKN